MVVLLLAGLFANWSAPRKLQSLAAPVHAEAAVNPAPAGSSVLSTVIVVFGALGTIEGSALDELSITTSLVPFSFFGRVNTATGVLSTSSVTFAVSSVTKSDWSGAGSFGPIVRRISSFDCACPTSITSSVSRKERFVRINGFARSELRLLPRNCLDSFHPAACPGFQLGADSTSCLV